MTNPEKASEDKDLRHTLDTFYADISESSIAVIRAQTKTLLHTQREEMVAKLEGMKPPVFLMQDGVSADFVARDTYNAAITDAIAMIKGHEKD